MTKIAILGGGQIGEALTSGLVESGFNASDITVTNRTASRGEELKSNYGVNVSADNAAAVDGADYIFASVKPYAILDLLSEINPAKDAVVVSMAAGLTLEALQAAAGEHWGVFVQRISEFHRDASDEVRRLERLVRSALAAEVDHPVAHPARRRSAGRSRRRSPRAPRRRAHSWWRCSPRSSRRRGG